MITQSKSRFFRRNKFDERYEKVIETWIKATDDLTNILMDNMNELNNIYIMTNSGARGSMQQIRQLAGIRQ